jgi:methyl-accepting chemotaxis protein
MFRFVADWSIKTKVAIAFSLVLVTTATLGIFAIDRLGAVNEAASEIRDNWLPSTRFLGEIALAGEQFRAVEGTYLLAENVLARGNAEELLKKAEEHWQEAWKAYEAVIAPGEERALADAISKSWTGYIELHKQMTDLVDQSSHGSAVALFSEDMLKSMEDYRTKLRADLDFNLTHGKLAADHGSELHSSSRIAILGALGLAVLLCVAAASVIITGVLRPIAALTVTMGHLAKHDLETKIAGLGRTDEIGRMADAVQVFKESMIETDRLHDAQAAEAAAKEQRAGALMALMRDFEAKVGQLVGSLSTSATQMEGTAQSMSSTAEETNQRSVAVAAAAEQASANVQTVATAAEELSSSVAEIGRQVVQSSKIAGKAVEDARRTDATVQQLATGAQKIGEVVTLIQDIASQTNLLALNATIEAARAGEAGKGFAVVASEVKSLANQTAKATEEISGQITQIQESTQQAVEAIRGIGQVIGEISEITATVAAAVEEQGAATHEIARNVEEASRGTADVTRNISGVREASATTGSAAGQVLNAAGELTKQAEFLSAEVNGFLANVRAA